MMMDEYRLPLRENRYQKGSSLPCFVLCLIIVLLIDFLTRTPGRLTQLYRPVFIGVCLVFLQKGRYPIPKGAWALIAFHFYLALVLICTDTSRSSVRSYFSMVLFCGFFICAVCRRWTKREIRIILFIVSAAGLFAAVAALIENPNLRAMNGGAVLQILGGEKNRNAVAFSLVPAALCSAVMLEFNRQKTLLFRIFYLLVLLVTAYTTIATGCRSAGAAVIGGVFLVIWEMTRHGRTANVKLTKKVLIVLGALAALFAMIVLTRGTNSARLFHSIFDGNGRDYLWDFAKDLIREKPIFGGGFNYWDSMGGPELGTHNTVLHIMVISGCVGAAFLAAFFLIVIFELWEKRNYALMAFLGEFACHTYSESSLDYYAYLPLILAYILFGYMKYQQADLPSIFELEKG